MFNHENTRANRTTDLCQRAERVLHPGWDGGHARYPQELENLLRELQMHQTELEAQNAELQQAQLQLSAACDQYTELYDRAPVGYMTIGIDNLIKQGNLTSASLLGMPQAQLTNKPLAQFVLYADQDLLYHHQRRVFAEPQTLHTVELRLIRTETTSFYAQLESRAVLLDESQVIGYRTIVSDITVRKQHEAALIVRNQKLVKTLEQLQTTQKTLVQQERLAAIGNLAAGIAHDFNNILTIISNYTALMLLPTTLEENARKKLKIIKEQSELATQLVQQLLDFSRRSTIARRSIELHSLLANTVQALVHTLPSTIQLTLHSRDESCFTNGDFSQLQQVIINLVRNAHDAMPDGGTIAIDLTTYEELPTNRRAQSVDDGSQTWACIKVTDSGTGIAPTILPHIFEPFFTTKAASGSGLGLAQVYGIIQQHGGEIEVASTVGKGTTVTLYLPRCGQCQIAEPDPVTPGQLACTSADPLSPDHRETILVVDDNAPLRDALAELLEMMGYNVLSQADGTTAIELYRQRGPEIALVLTDLSMPQMNGLELANALYALNPEVKIIISTGYLPDSVNKDQTDGLSVTWLPKPIHIDLLRNTLARLLDES